MKINKNKFYKLLFILILLSQIYLPSFKFNVLFQFAIISTYFYFEKATLSVRILKLILPLIFIFFIGFIGLLIHGYPLIFVTKDLFHFIKPLQGLAIGFFFFKTINNNKTFIQTIVITALISALIHFLILILFADLASGSITAIREYTRDNFLELIALFFLGTYSHFFHDDLFQSKNKSRIIFILLLLSCILYFSRTMMICALLVFLTIKGYTRTNQKSIYYLGLTIIGVALLYAYLFSVKIDRNKPGLEAFLYKVKIAPSEIFKTKIDRENHKDLWDHWRGYEVKRAVALMNEKPSSFLVGTGFGSLVNLKFKAPLTGDAIGIKYISELHNGYVYILYKNGIVGLLFYISFLFGIYKYIYKKNTFETVFISALGLFYFFTTLTITGLYNTNDTTVFVLGALLYYSEKNNKTDKL